MLEFLRSYGIWIVGGLLVLGSIWAGARRNNHKSADGNPGGGMNAHEQSTAPVTAKEEMQSHQHKGGCC